MKLLDTNIAVDFLRAEPPAISLLQDLADSDEPVVASELVRFELRAGARSSELLMLQEFFATLIWVPVDADVARVGGELVRRYRPRQGGIEDLDYLTAATALLLDAELLTTNVKHFPMLEGLEPAY
ncbi:MAG: type II toxin-antitoxin system VapC family toxin [Gaiellaceae bacterium]